MSGKKVNRIPAAPRKELVRERSNTESMCPVWVFDLVDTDGEFAFNTSREDMDYRLLISKLIDYGRMPWGEICRQTHDRGKSKHHYLDVSGMSGKARERIRAKKLEEQTDAIFSFALMNKVRVIGIRDRREFHPVWYDPEHEFYPSGKK